ncbi:LysR family transcriptional regulator [Anaerorhabdus furcosa]|uniref:DNA-binding transcriptional regulator, LysR family n=1 Tax=Anaerorhabdus furcosa TaxID=118967 RepID=A0A1T4K2A6_9FIRM|nr:LysR family transcriptional regulator [Anaerorhabdus furcosa]SJZ36509.1 DNA-binding transcriptional regulator, LysR family [Anaerorhabdus furcosa]
MELRVLEYFLAVAREQSISGAAESLHLSQPTLSRQLKDMEDELGKQLIVRGNRKISLTEEGMILRKRAEEILDLVRKTENEIQVSDDYISGDIYIGTGETHAMQLIAMTAKEIQEIYPNIHFHIVSGDSVDIIEKLNRGLYDFAILLGEIDTAKYDSIELPCKDTWGVLTRKDSTLAKKKEIHPQDLWNEPLLLSRQSVKQYGIPTWLKRDITKLNVTATYNLIYNASLMVQERMGHAITLDHLVNTSGDSELCFKPLSPSLEIGMHIVWKKYQIFSKPTEIFLSRLQEKF